jgi:hypothetical protein
VRALQYERKEENMNKKRTIFTAVILGEAAVGLAPMTAWSQEAPQETRQPYPELTRPVKTKASHGCMAAAHKSYPTTIWEAVEQALEEKGYDVGKVDGRAEPRSEHFKGTRVSRLRG